MRTLIFGGAAMLAHDLVHALDTRGHQTTALSHDECDITDPQRVLRAVRVAAPDVVFNCAAFTKVDEAESHPKLAMEVNGFGAGNVASAAATIDVPVVHISTDYVFDGKKPGGYVETDPVSPLSVYGRSKVMGEHRVRTVNRRHLIVRSQWLYGIGGTNFVQTMLRQGQAGSRIQVVDDQVGSPTSTTDLAAALVVLAEDKAYGTYHVTNAGQCTWRQFAELIFSLTVRRVTIDPITTDDLNRPARRPLHSVLMNRQWCADGRAPLRCYDLALAEYLERHGEGI